MLKGLPLSPHLSFPAVCVRVDHVLAGTLPIPGKCEACLSTLVYMKQGLQGNHAKLWTCTHTSLRIGIVSMYIHIYMYMQVSGTVVLGSV